MMYLTFPIDLWAGLPHVNNMPRITNASFVGS